MKKFVKLIFILIFGINQNLISQNLEIYQVKQSFPKFSDENKSSCNYCFNPSTDQLFEKPLITEKDIVSFNWETQTIKLTDEARNRMRNLEIPLQGLAVAITIDKEIIYGFWFWNMFSSFGCDYVYAFPESTFQVIFHKPFYGGISEDPRFDYRLKTYIENSKINKD